MNKILIIRFSSLGDILLASPLIRGLRTTYPRAQIDFLLKPEYSDLVRFNPQITSVLELKDSSFSGLQSMLGRVRQERYDLIVDIHNSLRSRYIRLLSNAKHSVVINKRIIARWLLVNFKWNIYDTVTPASKRYIETCKRLNVQDDGRGLEIIVPEQTFETVATFMSKYKLERHEKVIGLVPSARHFTKRWLPERFIEFGTRSVKEQKAKLFIFGGKDDITYCNDIAQMINMQAGPGAAESLAGKLSLIETAAALDYCSVILSNDSGLMHLAQARGRNLAAVFGSTVRELGFYPISENSVVIEAADVPCRPCSHIGRASCPKGHFNCMTNISVDDVMKAVETFII